MFVRLKTSPLPFSFMRQTEFTTFRNFLINREVPFLFKSIDAVNFAIIYKYNTFTFTQIF